MKAFEVWQRLWEKADVECQKAFNDYDYAVHHEWPTSEILACWNTYDRWYKVRDFIRIRHMEAAINRTTK